LTHFSSKKHPEFYQMCCQVWLAHPNITHWFHMGDIKWLGTIYKGVVTITDVCFLLSEGEKIQKLALTTQQQKAS
jgi:hypothetical protein